MVLRSIAVEVTDQVTDGGERLGCTGINNESRLMKQHDAMEKNFYRTMTTEMKKNG